MPYNERSTILSSWIVTCPEMDGYEATTMIRRQEKLWTTHADHCHDRECFAGGSRSLYYGWAWTIICQNL